MIHKLEQFHNISWNNTTFQVLQRTDTELRIAFDSVSLPGERPRRREITFFGVSNEWATLWSQPMNEWIDHPDPANSIGKRIEEVAAKKVARLKFSFGGHHELGWSRWGFTATSFRIDL